MSGAVIFEPDFRSTLQKKTILENIYLKVVHIEARIRPTKKRDSKGKGSLT